MLLVAEMFRYSSPLILMLESGSVNNNEITSVEKYLRQAFDNDSIGLDRKTKKDDSIEVTMKGEFIGVIYRDDEDDELSYSFNMAILAEDLTS